MQYDRRVTRRLAGTRATPLPPVMVDAKMREFDRMLGLVANKDVTVTLVGESGSGKEVMAQRLHMLSKRRNGPFVPINCAAIPESLFESELFGYERGAFTGAAARGPGKIEAARGGTLLLDEVGELPLALQPKLLRFLETHRFMRVGGTTKLDMDVRIVLATLRPLEADVVAGRFRADLYYRIQGIMLHVPPLRERRRDILVLTDAFLQQLSIQHDCTPPRLTAQARAVLLRYAWPGNVRQLRNVIEFLTIMRSGAKVTHKDLPMHLMQPVLGAAPAQSSAIEPLATVVERTMVAAVDAEGGNLERAARRLQVNVRTLQRRLRAGH